MASNIEIKAVLKDRAEVEAVAARLSDTAPEVIHQYDVFFRCEGARLKLRILGTNHGELIRYQRADAAEVRRSNYTIARTEDPHALLDILTPTLGRTGEVRKTRTLYVIGQTRVHLDRVDGLGDFLELEVVLRPDQGDGEGRHIAEALLSEFHIEKEHLLAEAYVDLLARQTKSAAS